MRTITVCSPGKQYEHSEELLVDWKAGRDFQVWGRGATKMLNQGNVDRYDVVLYYSPNLGRVRLNGEGVKGSAVKAMRR